MAERQGNPLPEETRREPDGFEPFSTEPGEGQKFINLYGGSFYRNLELNRVAVEEIIRVAALQGNIVLISVPKERDPRSVDINPDGSATRKRSLFWGEKPQEDEPQRPVRVVSTPQGWKVEVCDEMILEDLVAKESKKPIDLRFAKKLNVYLRTVLGEVIFKEKFTENKHYGSLWLRCMTSSAYIIGAMFLPENLIEGNYSGEGIIAVSFIVFSAGWMKDLSGNPTRNLTAFYEYLMPQIELDRVIAGKFILETRGRRLVRIAPKSGE
ncbi:MAG: hypothetical protein Q7S45_00890 [Candidatus Curtissbacteria bacterium]|nr:hypothetical protein [Candidatus Curtissbacteria bacterium]